MRRLSARPPPLPVAVDPGAQHPAVPAALPSIRLHFMIICSLSQQSQEE